MKSLTRRQALVLLSQTGLAVAAGLLSGCVATPASAPSESEKAVTDTPESAEPSGASEEVVEIEWWSSWTAGGRLGDIAAAFNDSHPGIRVNYVNVPGAEIQAKAFAAIAAGNPPDTAFNLPYLEYAARGLCVQMDEYIAVTDGISMTDGDIPDYLWDKFNWQGKQYGIPAVDTAVRYGIGYNLNLIENAGLNTDSLPQTWDEVFEWHKAITTYDDAGNVDILGIAPTQDSSASAHTMDPWLYPEMWGFHYFDDKSMAFDIDRPETVEFLEMINSFWSDVGPEKMSAFAEGMEGISWTGFGAGKEAMRITYPSGPGSVYRQVGEDYHFKYTWVPMPSARKGIKIATIGGHAAIILHGSKHPEEAFQYCVFLTQKEACDILFAVNGWAGPRRSYQDSIDMSQFFPEDVGENVWFFLRTALEEADEIWVEKDPIGSVTNEEWQILRESVIYGDRTPKEAAQRMQEKLTEELSQFQQENT